MVRFSFSPGAKKQSRKDRIEQAKRESEEEKARRRNFGFLKNAERRVSSRTMDKTREHAKQLALAWGEPAETPTSVNSGQGLLNSKEETFDPFGHGAVNSPTEAQITFSSKRAVSNATGLMLDQHFASSTTQEPTASTLDTFETASVGSAYDLDLFPKPKSNMNTFHTTPTRKTNKLDRFVERTRSQPSAHGPGSTSGASFDGSRGKKSTSSMSTFPANSSMQSSFVRQSSPAPSPATGAAARRRFRNQLRHSSSASVSSSIGDDSSFHSGMATPPESPASSTRNIPGSAGKNRLAAYQRSQTGSFVSTTSSTGNNSNQSSSEFNLFDSQNPDGGFTFDAFGLDQAQVEREVNDAMHALAGQGVSGFSVFFNNDTDGDFSSQGWDSPATSRRSSPVPSDSETDGFTDGFRINQTPSRSMTSPMSTERSIPSPAAGRHFASQAKETITPTRWQDPRDHFAGDAFEDSNPWKEDPWASEGSGGEEGESFSDFAAKSDYGGTQSEAFPASFPPQHDFPKAFPSSKSDIGVAAAHQKSVSFHKDVRSPRNRHHQEDYALEDSGMKEDVARAYARDFVRRISPRHTQQQSVERSFDDYGEASRPQHEDQNFSSAPQQHFGFDQDHEVRNRVAPLDVQEEMYQAEFGAPEEPNEPNQQQNETAYADHHFGLRLQISGYCDQKEAVDVQDDPTPEEPNGLILNQRQNENVYVDHRFDARLQMSGYDDQKEEFDVQDNQLDTSEQSEDYASGKQTPMVLEDHFDQSESSFASSAGSAFVEEPRNQVTPPKEIPESRFASIRARYSLSRGPANAPVDNPAAPAESTFESKTRRNLRNSYEAAKTRASIDRIQEVADSQSRRTDEELSSELSGSRIEEKKEDDPSPAPVSSQNISSLKSKWQQWESESAQKQAQTAAFQSIPKRKTTNSQPSQHEALSGVEFVTPELLEARRQEKRKSRSEELRQSNHETENTGLPSKVGDKNDQLTTFSSLRDRLRPASTSKAKSDAGGNYRSSLVSSVVDKYKSDSPRGGPIKSSSSDTGSSPSFLAGVKLRKTGSGVLSPHSKPKPEEDESSGGFAQTVGRPTQPSDQLENSSEPIGGSITKTCEKQVERKLTYRERRELELKREQEANANVEAEKPAPKKDVAALIRKRIAANKQKSAAPVPATESGTHHMPPLNRSSNPYAVPSQPCPSPPEQNSNSGNAVGNHKPLPSIGTEQPMYPPRNNIANDLSPRTNIISSSPVIQTDHVNDDEPAGSAFLDQLSPASEGSNLTYSTDGSQKKEQVRGLKTPRSPIAKENQQSEERFATSNRLEALLAKKPKDVSLEENSASEVSSVPKPVNRSDYEPPEDGFAGKSDVKNMLSSFLGARNNPLASLPAPKKENDVDAIQELRSFEKNSPEKKSSSRELPPPPPPPGMATGGQRPALKDDPKYERYFRMLKVGMPMEVVKHAMLKDGNDPSVMDGDHNLPVGIPLKEDPKYEKYFKMLKIGISMPQVKHAMERDGLNTNIMDQDHNLPAMAPETKSKDDAKPKDTKRRARLHWKTLKKIARNSLWSKIQKEPEVTNIDFDEEEFQELFQADLTNSMNTKPAVHNKKKGAAVRVIDAKRANNGGIILARVKMTHDEMADAVDRIDGDALNAEQIENIIEFLPTKEERAQLEKYMLEGGQDAAEKFDGLCECEKFMVSMMTVKHAKRKVNALLFKLQFINCLQSIAEDTQMIDDACDELQHSTRLRQLLGIVLQFGNRLNTAGKSKQNTAGAFTLDSLLKLSQAKAFDKKTTFLHYVVMIVHRNNEILLNFSDDLPTVMKSDKIFWDQCLQDLEEVENQLENVRQISLFEAKTKKSRKDSDRIPNDDESLGDFELSLEEEVEALRATPTGLFTLSAIKQVSALRDKVEATRKKFVRVLEYFGEDPDSIQPHELFNIFCVFGRDFNKAKDEAFANMKKKQREERKKAGGGHGQSHNGNKNGKPPSAPTSKTLRVSNMQPHMNKVISDFRGPNNQRSDGNVSRDDERGPAVRPSYQPSHYGSSDNGKRGHPEGQSNGQSWLPKDVKKQDAVSQHNGGIRQSTRHSTLQGREQESSKPEWQRKEHDWEHTRKSSSQDQSHMQVTTSLHNDQRLQTSNTPYASMHDASIPRGMQESGRFEELPMGYYGAKPSEPHDSSASQSLRQKARDRRQRQMDAITNPAASVPSNVSSPEARSPRSSPNSADGSLGEVSGTPKSNLSSRAAMRHRRLQAMKKINASKNHSRPGLAVASQVSTN